jgi:predicted nucleotide-binding protein
MAKRILTQVTDNMPTELLYFKAEFKKVLLERIVLGDELFNRQLQTKSDLNKNKDDFYKWDNFNSEYLRKAFNKDANEFKKSYDESISSFFSSFDIRNSPLQDIKNFKDKVNNKISRLKKIRDKIDSMKTSVVKNSFFKKHEIETSHSKIFIVPGHDYETFSKTINFIENLGFEAIILHDSIDKKTIINKIEQHTDVNFALILHSPNSEDQNIYLNHGFLIGKMGRNKVCVLVNENLENQNDISGIVYVAIDETDLWCYSVARELKKAGYNLDMKKYNCA